MEECALRLPVKLGQFLKIVNWAESGGEARALIQSGAVEVNGVPEIRHSHHLQEGDVVALKAENGMPATTIDTYRLVAQ